MTTELFKCHAGVVGVHIGVGTDEHELTGDECRDLLNELSEENNRLKQQIGNLEHTRDFVGDVCADCERLEKENERLRRCINSIYTIARLEEV